MKSLINWKKSSQLNNPFFTLQKEIDKVINDFYSSADIPSSILPDIEKLIIRPSIDVIEDDQEFKVEVEMPGMDEKDIKILINNGILSIQGQKEISKKDEKKNYVNREIGYGSYERKITLPDYVEAEKAKASFKKGMLWVVFPKKPGAQNQLLEIKVEKENH